MENQIAKVEQVFDRRNDRWIYTEYNSNDEVIGLNFMQGNEYDLFKRDYCDKDNGLTDYYQQMICTLAYEYGHSQRIDFINTVIWSYISAVQCFEDSRAWNCEQCSESRSGESAN